jgi:uncharacterized protein (TIGR02145 family)
MKNNYSLFFLFILSIVTVECMSTNLVLNFTASGASTTLDSVIIINTIKSRQIKVESSNTLSLDIPDGIEDVYASSNTIAISPNPVVSSALITFPVINSGSAALRVYSLNGKLIMESNNDLKVGQAQFKIELPKGVFLVNVAGVGYNYSSKLISETINHDKFSINLESNEMSNQQFPLIKKSSASQLINDLKFEKGDQLFFKAYSSGKYCTYYTESPSESKTINFNFVDCTDADDNHYATVKIGTQIWMAENLYTTKFRNGDAIPNVTDGTSWVNLSTPGQCSYKNTINIDSISKFGRLYNWFVVGDKRNVAPVGWHVSTDAEWVTLTDYLAENSGVSLSNLKAMASSTDWLCSSDYSPGAIGYDTSINNSSGFCALPIGSRLLGTGWFRVLNKLCSWWTSDSYDNDNAWSIFISVNALSISNQSQLKQIGCSIRCIKD